MENSLSPASLAALKTTDLMPSVTSAGPERTFELHINLPATLLNPLNGCARNAALPSKPPENKEKPDDSPRPPFTMTPKLTIQIGSTPAETLLLLGDHPVGGIQHVSFSQGVKSTHPHIGIIGITLESVRNVRKDYISNDFVQLSRLPGVHVINRTLVSSRGYLGDWEFVPSKEEEIDCPECLELREKLMQLAKNELS